MFAGRWRYVFVNGSLLPFSLNLFFFFRDTTNILIYGRLLLQTWEMLATMLIKVTVFINKSLSQTVLCSAKSFFLNYATWIVCFINRISTEFLVMKLKADIFVWHVNIWDNIWECKLQLSTSNNKVIDSIGFRGGE